MKYGKMGMALLLILAILGAGSRLCLAESEDAAIGEKAAMEQGFNRVPDVVRAIKYDPFVSPRDDFDGDNQTTTVAEKVAGWKECGFNTVYLIVFHRGGSICFPAQAGHRAYETALYGDDFLRALTEECNRQGMCLFAGAWVFRDDPIWNQHPEWRQKMSGQLDANEELLCPFSPYLEECFYPPFQEMYDTYGISNFFLQEMWFNWDGLGRSSSFSAYSLEAFNQRTGGNWSLENVTELEKRIGDDPETRDAWYQMHFDKEVEIIDRLRAIGGGTVAWHNMREAEWPLVMAAPERLEGVFINSMSLYPEIQIWDAKGTDEFDPFLTYRWARKQTDAVRGFRRVLEYYSLYGYNGVTRPLEEKDFINIYLAARASGFQELVVEQDAFIIRMDQWKAGAWDAIALSYRLYDPIFEGAEFIGTAKNAVWADGKESTNGNRRFLTAWQKDDTEIILAGVSTYKKPVELTLLSEGKTVRDEQGNIIADTAVLIDSGEVRLFILEGEPGS